MDTNPSSFSAMREAEPAHSRVASCDRCGANEHAELRLRESHHRIANALQMTSSVMRLQSIGAESEEARAELRSAHQRIESIAIVHRLLCDASPDFVDLGVYLQSLIDGIGRTWDLPSCSTRLSLGVETSVMSGERASCVGMIVNELVSNAYKYAFPEGRHGTISVALSAAGGLFVLEVVDDGVGFEGADLAFRDGLGLRMVDAMARRLSGSYHREYVRTGAKAVICFPQAYPFEIQPKAF